MDTQYIVLKDRKNSFGNPVLINSHPSLALPIYRCSIVFDTRGKESEHPLAHLERFIDFLEYSPRKFNVICIAKVTEEAETLEEEISLDEAELADLPDLLALKQPEILMFFNSSIRELNIVENPLTGETEFSNEFLLNALQYTKSVIFDCKVAGLVVPNENRRRLAPIFPMLFMGCS
ncbi:MAG: hypothetical protein WBK19_11000 [Azonexus sp.]